ncbi:hypothetical protein [Moraxella lacunata]|uniref:Uncharacterized protein n=1 Tax=Moraxella lacunata TaxID=477 RepID=A0A1V4GV35_MORLA|nr:hypothetical protein [Moraxella lacunata]OPH36515.1 hypothetical protein B5J94_07225 [Moraxella lacunata]
MAQGLQVWDVNGNLTLDSNVQTTSIFGKIVVSSANEFNIQDNRFAWGTPFFLADSMLSGYDIKGVFDAQTNTYRIKVDDDKGGFGTKGNFTIYYGVF